MSSVQYLREFIRERLTAAAEEIFGVFEKTFAEYQEEVYRERRLLDTVWKPEIKLHRIELPQQHDCTEEEVLADQQVCNQERDPSLGQEDPEPLQVKEEQEEICTSREGEQLVLKQESDTFTLIPTYKESDNREPEPDGDQQLLSHDSPVAESRDQGGRKDLDSTRDAESGEKLFKCDTCGKLFKYKCAFTTQKPYTCKTCGRRFCYKSVLTEHVRLHTGEKPYSCETCGKRFVSSGDLKVHSWTHMGEKPHQCDTCGKRFSQRTVLKKHVRTHMGEKPYSCKTCGERFNDKSTLKLRMKVQNR